MYNAEFCLHNITQAAKQKNNDTFLEQFCTTYNIQMINNDKKNSLPECSLQ